MKFEYCKPVNANAVPTGDEWLHEIKYDGYRGRIVRDGKNVRLLSMSGLDWAWRFPWIVETALKIKQSRFIIDGEICVLDAQGISDFDALHSNKHNDEAQLYAFDLISMGGEDFRDAPLLDRKGRLEKLLAAARRASSWRNSNASRSDQSYLPPLAACGSRASCQSINNGATERERATGLKVKNRQHPAFSRAMDTFG